MHLIINGKEETVNAEFLTITELLGLKKVEMPEFVSVQLNDDFVDRKNFDSQAVREDDRVDFLYFMGGGEKSGEQKL